nr:hypothetical protein BaRGS_014769 [Batillaria attramentaria]
MLYGLFGVPLTLLCLAKVGNAMAKYLKLSYSRVVCRPCTDQNEEPHVPLFVCVGLVMAYLFLGAELFCYWEGWDLMDAVYFCFTSLITVGFGDMLPGSDLQEENRDAKTVVCIAYLLLGLGLLAMCCVLMKQDCVNVTLRCGRCLVVAKPRRLSHTAASAKARGDHRA